MVDVRNRKVLFFRCHIDPGIGPMPKHAIHVIDMKLEAELLPMGVYVKLPSGEEHIVPYANCQTIKLQKQDPISISAPTVIDQTIDNPVISFAPKKGKRCKKNE